MFGDQLPNNWDPTKTRPLRQQVERPTRAFRFFQRSITTVYSVLIASDVPLSGPCVILLRLSESIIATKQPVEVALSHDG